MSRGRFIRQYGAYAASRAVPSLLPASSSIVRHRYRYQVFNVNPTRIDAKPGFSHDPRSDREQEIELLEAMTHRFAVAGDWDMDPRPFGLHPAVEDIFVRGLPPRRTRTYARMVDAAGSGDLVTARGCTTSTDVDAWFSQLIAIYDQIAMHGYRNQLQLRRPPGDEISVCIGRDGRLLLLRHGNHRLSIAKVLAVPRVPVIIRGVHADWFARQARSGPRAERLSALDRGLRELCMEPPA